MELKWENISKFKIMIETKLILGRECLDLKYDSIAFFDFQIFIDRY